MICPNCGERIRGANKRKVRGIYRHKCRPVETRNKELLRKLREQYKVALANIDYDKIDNLMAPIFWKLFNNHFKIWSKSWRSSLTLQTINELPPREKRKVKNFFMDQILSGKIDPKSISLV